MQRHRNNNILVVLVNTFSQNPPVFPFLLLSCLTSADWLLTT